MLRETFLSSLLPGNGNQCEVVVSDHLTSHHIFLSHKLLAEELRVLVPDHPGRRLAAHDNTRELDLGTLLVRSSIQIQHCASVIQDLRSAWPHNHSQVDSLCSRLRGCEIHPTSEIFAKILQNIVFCKPRKASVAQYLILTLKITNFPRKSNMIPNQPTLKAI